VSSCKSSVSLVRCADKRTLSRGMNHRPFPNLRTCWHTAHSTQHTVRNATQQTVFNRVIEEEELKYYFKAKERIQIEFEEIKDVERGRERTCEYGESEDILSD
jgi:hypothetical protein